MSKDIDARITRIEAGFAEIERRLAHHLEWCAQADRAEDDRVRLDQIGAALRGAGAALNLPAAGPAD